LASNPHFFKSGQQRGNLFNCHRCKTSILGLKVQDLTNVKTNYL